ncbi:MAG: hypothetical protein H6Q96_1036 [Nitrospirae bacterium]|nr:hypothetical protein [Nitrospirota bacterium]
MRISHIILIIICLLCTSFPVQSAEQAMDKLLPAPACAEGWVMDGRVTLYDKDSLFDRINGESELYFPYGFEKLAYARYADVYAMGSLLDAFGMFANYRRKNSTGAAIGADGTISSSQMLFYQDRYLVRLQVTGATTIGQDVLLACGKAIAQNLPQSTARPKELDAFLVPAVVKKSERYIASSLLGYDFFRRGLIADAVLGSDEAQVFLVLEKSTDAARAAFDQYQAYLKTGGSNVRVTESSGRMSLEAVDPLYGAVVVQQTGRFLAGAVRVKDRGAAKQLIENVLVRAGKE